MFTPSKTATLCKMKNGKYMECILYISSYYIFITYAPLVGVNKFNAHYLLARGTCHWKKSLPVVFSSYEIMRWNISILTLLLFINQFQREFWYNSNISCTSSAAAGARLSSDTEQQWENARREIPFYERAELICGTIERMRWLWHSMKLDWAYSTHPTRIKNVHISYHCPRADYKKAEEGFQTFTKFI